MAISSARMKELIAKYDVIKGKVEDIDRKYSLDYREPLLNMPESLGLTKLQYVPKTEEQLRAARKSVLRRAILQSKVGWIRPTL